MDDRVANIDIQFERQSIITKPGPCPVCDGKGYQPIRSRFDEKEIGKRPCGWCAGSGRIPRT